MRDRARLWCVCFLVTIFFRVHANAQTYSRWEAGLQSEGMALSDPNEERYTQAGIGARVTYNFSSLFHSTAKAHTSCAPNQQTLREAAERGYLLPDLEP